MPLSTPYTAHGREVLNCTSALACVAPTTQGAKNIARILNAHDDLLAAVELFVRDVADNGLPPTMLDAWERARVALTKAKGTT